MLCPALNPTVTSLLPILRRGYRSSDEDFGEKEALEWANGFAFPTDFGRLDTEGLAAHGYDLAAFVRSKQARMSQRGRLSRARVDSVVDPSDPDYERLLDLVDGIPIEVHPDFEPNGEPPPLRTKYVRLAPVVNRLLYEMYGTGVLTVIDAEAAARIEGVHYSATHWALKRGKPCGRPIGDASASEGGHPPLNSQWVKDRCDQRWGVIHHPTTKRLASMILDYAAESGSSLEDLILWKMDLKGAFTLLFVKPEDVRLLGFALTDDLVLFYHCGMFGHSSMPGVFDVVTRPLSRAVAARIRGRCTMYVDDLQGVSKKADLPHDLGVAKSICETLLGPGSVADEKTEAKRRIDWLGWTFDLDLGTVSISDRNFCRALYGFSSVDTTRPIPVRTLERLASWAARYSAVCRALKPFTSDLYAAFAGRSRRVSVTPNDALTHTIFLWRAMLTLLELRRELFTRPISSFPDRPASFRICYDASLTGIGVIVRSTEGRILAALRAPAPFDLQGDSSFQNTMEFLAVTMGLLVLAKFLDARSAAIDIEGDNRSSLAWASTQRFRSGPSRPTAMLFVALCSVFDLSVADSIHIAGELNTLCDGLSRDRQLADIPSIPTEAYCVPASSGLIASVYSICNPMAPFDFSATWLGVCTVAEGLSSNPL